MLKRENYSSEHIDALRKQTGADPSILERTVFAFGLLEALCRVKMPFIFKGGTSLLILLDEPRRLSTDIDIIVAPGTDVDGFIQQAGQIFPFRDVKENIRKGNNGIEKRHFRFLFNSPRQGKEISILLDVVFEDNPYAKLITNPVQSRLLMSEGDSLLVTVPDKNCVLGDKLTAFAPHTTGIPFGIDKELMLCQPNEKEGRFLLEEIMRGGNFGHYDERNRFYSANDRFRRGLFTLRRNLRYLRHYPSEVLWKPLWQIWHWCWRKWKGYL
jgi:hypothetical protein